MGAGNLASSLVPETLDNCLSYTVLNYLKRLKNQVRKEMRCLLYRVVRWTWVRN